MSLPDGVRSVSDTLRLLGRLRRTIASIVHLPLSVIGLYAKRSTARDQYALTVNQPYREFEATLDRLGFVRNLLSSLKQRRYAAPEENAVGSWVSYPHGLLASDEQLHLALYDGPDRSTTDVYAHCEPSMIRHPIQHYRARKTDAEKGVKRIRQRLSEADVDYVINAVDKRYKRPTAPS